MTMYDLYCYQALLVTGGYSGIDPGYFYIPSTEIYAYSVWSFAAPLIPGRAEFLALTLDNSVFVFGEFLIQIIHLIFQQVNKYLTVFKEDNTGQNSTTEIGNNHQMKFSNTMETLTNG